MALKSFIRETSVVVFGLGTFGSQTARALYRGGAIVLAIDNDETIIERISPDVTVAVRADATDADALREVGAFDMNVAIVAIRRQFDTTVLVTHMLRRNGVKEVLVQVDSEKEASAIRAVGATDVIFPERDMAHQLARRMLTPGLADQIPLDSEFSIIEVPVAPNFTGQSLLDLEIRRKYGVTVVALKDVTPGLPANKSFQIAPAADMPLEERHHLLVLGDRKHLLRFKDAAGVDEEE